MPFLYNNNRPNVTTRTVILTREISISGDFIKHIIVCTGNFFGKIPELYFIAESVRKSFFKLQNMFGNLFCIVCVDAQKSVVGEFCADERFIIVHPHMNKYRINCIRSKIVVCRNINVSMLGVDQVFVFYDIALRFGGIG